MWSVLYRNRDDESSIRAGRGSRSSSLTDSSSTSSGSATTNAASMNHQHRRLQAADLMDLVDLQDFNVQLARVNDAASTVQVSQLMNLITEWMNDSFEHQLSNLKYANGKYASFDTVMLLERKERRALLHQAAPRLRRVAETTTPSSSTTGQLFTANIKGAALFSRNATQDSVPLDVVHFLQESALTNKSGLLALVQASGAAGLGASVVDLNAFTVATSSGSGSSGGGGGNASLEAIIIIAVAVAAVAFLFLLVAIFWAWRYDRRNRQAYLVNGGGPGGVGAGGVRHASSKETRRSDPTNSQSTIEEHIRRTSKGGKGSRKNQAPVSEIGGDSVLGGIPGTGSGMPSGLYPESVISEDISTALSQYYRSGLSYSHSAVGGGAGGGGGGSHPFRSSSSRMDHLNDAASVSSMESYGYSLDGYAPSTATPMPRDAAPPIHYPHASSAHQPRDPEDDDDEEYDEDDPVADEDDDEEVGPRVAADGLQENADRDEEKF